MSESAHILYLANRLASAVIQDSPLNTDSRALDAFTDGLANVLTNASEAFVAAALLFREHGVAMLNEKES